jgi:hypothetical protein
MSYPARNVAAMTPAELTLTAALGSSALTGAVSFGVLWLQGWRRQRTADRAALHQAYADLLSRSLAVAMRAKAISETMRLRSGLTEGVDVTLRQRKPLDLFEFHDWVAKDLAPLNDALTEIWTRADQQGIRLANEVVSTCADLLGVSTAVQKPANGWERLRTWAVGVRWTPEMIADNDRVMKELAHARKRFAEHARARFGRDAVELFTLAEPQDEPAALEAPPTATPNGNASAAR